MISFVGEDSNGSFGLQTDHARLMTALVFGLFQYRLQNEEWQYLALQSGVLYFNNNELSISTQQYEMD